MFKNPFSFEGRIRRTEFVISYIMAAGALLLVAAIAGKMDLLPLYYIFLIAFFWFIWSQGAKRCHDMGNSGWFQIIPFYVLWMLLQEGQSGSNQYGENPNGI